MPGLGLHALSVKEATNAALGMTVFYEDASAAGTITVGTTSGYENVNFIFAIKPMDGTAELAAGATLYTDGQGTSPLGEAPPDGLIVSQENLQHLGQVSVLVFDAASTATICCVYCA